MNPEIIGLCVAVLALAFTIWQGWLTRSHNRLSVRPYVVSRQKRNRDKNGVGLTYELANTGLGPAIIAELRVTLSGRLIEDVDPIAEILRQCIGQKVEYVLRSSSRPSQGYALKPGEDYLLADVYFPKLSPESEKWLGQLLEPADLTLAYRSLYNEKFLFAPTTEKPADSSAIAPAVTVTHPAAPQ